MNQIATSVGYFVMLAFTAGLAMFVVNYLVCCATKAWCLAMGAHHLKMYSYDWSRARMFLWLFWYELKQFDVGKFSVDTRNGRFVCRWNNWNDWDYAGRK